MMNWNEMRASSLSLADLRVLGSRLHVVQRLGGIDVGQPQRRRQIGAGQVELAVEDVADLVVVDLVVAVRPGVPVGRADGVDAEVLGDGQAVARRRPFGLQHRRPCQWLSLMAHLV